MALPALIGMGWLATQFSTIALSFIGFQAASILKKIAIVGAVILSFVALTTAFILAIDGLLTTVAYSMPISYSSLFFLLPSNFVPAVSIFVTAKITHMLYQWTMKIVQSSLYIT